MSLTVKGTLKLPALRHLRILAGENGLDRVVTSATVLENLEVEQWLRGGEFLLTSFYAVRQRPDVQRELIRVLAVGGSAALAVKSPPFLNGLGDEILTLAEKLAFPVIEIPVELTYIDILNEIMRELVDDWNFRESQDTFIHDVLAGNVEDPNEFVHRSRTVGWTLNDAFVGTWVDLHLGNSPGTDGSEREHQEQLVRAQLMHQLGSHFKTTAILGTYGSSICVIFTVKGSTEESEIVNSILRDLQKVTTDFKGRHPEVTISAGIGPLVNRFQDIAVSIDRSQDALKTGKRVWGPGRIFTEEDLGPYRILGHLSKTVDLETLVEPALIELRHYDSEHGTELTRTLRSYLDVQGNLRLAGSQLFVHPKTVSYRIRRIKSLTGWNLKHPQKRLSLEIQLRLLDLIEYR